MRANTVKDVFKKILKNTKSYFYIWFVFGFIFFCWDGSFFVLACAFSFVCVNISQKIIFFFFLATACVSLVLSEWPKCEHNPIRGDFFGSSYAVLSCVLVDVHFLRHSRSGKEINSVFSVWLDLILFCFYCFSLWIFFFPAYFCLAISALPELTMWPAMYSLGIKKGSEFL